MSTIQKISTLSEWNSTTKNRILFTSSGMAKIAYFNHAFTGLSVDSTYWQIVNQIGNALSFNDSMEVRTDVSTSLTELRSRSYYTGDFDIYVSYADLNTGSTSSDKYVYFGFSDEDLDESDNINIRIGIGIEGGSVSMRTQVLETDSSSLLYSNTLAKNYTYGKLRIQKTSDTVEFFAENLSGTWESLGSYTGASILAHQDLYLYFSTEFGGEIASSSSADSLSSSSSVSSSFGTDELTIVFGEIAVSPVLSQFDGNIYFDYEYDENATTAYYSFFGNYDSSIGLISVRIKSASTLAGLDSASWTAFKTTSLGNFALSETDRFVRFNVKLVSYEYGYSPLLDSITVGLEQFLAPDETPVIVAPSPNEMFDNALRIIWKKPVPFKSNLAQRYYKIEFKNDVLGISDWVLVDDRVNPQAGYYDWNVKGMEDDGNYQLRITSIYAEVSDISATLPYRLQVSNAGNEEYNGIYTLVGTHNGENLYEGDGGFIYYERLYGWRMNSFITSESVVAYYSSTIMGIWNGGIPAPFVSEFMASTSDSSGGMSESSSSSYDFSSTSSISSSSSSTQLMTSSSSTLSSSSSESSSTERFSSSQSSSSMSSESSMSSVSSTSSSTERKRYSTSSSQSSSSTNRFTSSSSSSITALLKGVGMNSYGQIGVRSNDNLNTFAEVPVIEAATYRIVSAGAYHTFIEKQDGTVWACGRNSYGQLGFGDIVSRNEFTQLPSSFNNAKKIVCGEYFTVVEKSDGSVWTCGRNNKGQLGLGDNVDRNEFVQLPLKYTNPKHIAAGSEFLMIVKQNEYLDSVGANESGQLALHDTINRNSFEEVGIKVGSMLVAGSQFAYMVDTNKFVKSVGNNYHGQLGLGDTINRSIFTEVPGLVAPSMMAAGGGHIMIVTSTLLFMVCGDNNMGQLGLGDNTNRSEFVDTGFYNPKSISAGFHFSYFVSSSGELYSTGYNIYGQLGQMDYENRNSFTVINRIYDPVDVVCGGYHAFVISNIGESESSTERLNTSSSSDSWDEETEIYPFGYSQFSETNLTDIYGDFEGDAFYIPSGRIDAAILTHISSSNIGSWELQKYNIGSLAFEPYSELKVGSEVLFSNLAMGDIARVVFDGSAGTELLSYRLYMRGTPNNSSSSSSMVTKSTSSSQSSSSSSSSSPSSSSSSISSSSSLSSSSMSSSSESSSQSESTSSTQMRSTTSSQSSSSVSSSSSESSSSSSVSSSSSQSSSSSMSSLSSLSSSSSMSSSSISSSSFSSSSSMSSSSLSSSSVSSSSSDSSSSQFFLNAVRIVSPEAVIENYFGRSTSMSGDYAVVGRGHYETAYHLGEPSPYVHVYHRTGLNNWSSVATIPSHGGTDYNFGYSVSIDGDYLVVGNPSYGGAMLGWISIYHRTGINTWAHVIDISSSDSQSYDYFGASVAIKGDYIVVGAPSEDAGGTDAGAAYIFYYNGVSWSQQAKIMASDAQSGDKFGYSVAIDGDYVVVGAIGEDSQGVDSGAAYIFHRSGTTWSQQSKILPSSGSAYSNFGKSVTISGDKVAVSREYVFYIYTRSGSSWSIQAAITPPLVLSESVASVSIYGNYLAVGLDGSVNTVGHVHIYEYNGGWSRRKTITPSDTAQTCRFGKSVSLSGDNLVIGAPYYTNSAQYDGAIYIYLIDKYVLSSSSSSSSSP